MTRVALAWALSFATLGVASAQPSDPRQVAAEVHAEGGYISDVQFTSPEGGPGFFPSGGGSEADARRAARGGNDGIQGYQRGSFDPRPAAEPETSWWSFPNFSGPGPLLSKLLLIITVVGLIVLVGVLLIAFWPKGARPAMAPAVPRERAVSIQESEPLPWEVGDPDELARQGRFSEAILALLVLSLKRAGWREEQRSVTPREILAEVGPSDARRPPLGGVVGVAERVRFAGAPADEASFRAAREFHAQLLGLSTPDPSA